MKTVYKYPLGDMDISCVYSVKLPKSAEILDLQMPDGDLMLWAKVDTDKPEEIRNIYIIHDGGEFYTPDHKLKYLKTLFDDANLHFFEILA